MHVRRGDVNATGTESFRYTDNKTLRVFIDEVREQVGTDHEVVIVTEDPDADFKRSFADCRIVEDQDPVKAMLLLANADILIMGKSSFSFVAGLLSRGHVYYEKFWHPRLPSWRTLPTLPPEKF